AICAHETDSQARPVPAAGLERYQRRSTAHGNRAEPEAARQAPLPCSATLGGGLFCVGVASNVDGVSRRHNGKRDQRTTCAQTKPCNRAPRVLQQNRPRSGHPIVERTYRIAVMT